MRLLDLSERVKACHMHAEHWTDCICTLIHALTAAEVSSELERNVQQCHEACREIS